MASTTGAGQWPAFTTPIPPAKSINSLPSASVIIAPFASLTVAVLKTPTPLATIFFSCQGVLEILNAFLSLVY
jgi:hypothetical protein